jgi:hypothetical protein
MVSNPSSGAVRPGCLVGGFVILLVLGVGGYFLTEKLVTDKVEDLVRDNPVLREHLGELESIRLDRNATGETERALVFRVEGSKGEGELRVEFDEDGESLERGSVRLADGESHDLFPDRP